MTYKFITSGNTTDVYTDTGGYLGAVVKNDDIFTPVRLPAFVGQDYPSLETAAAALQAEPITQQEKDYHNYRDLDRP